MAHVKRGVPGRARHKKILRMAKGYRGRAKNSFRIAIEKVEKGLRYAYRDQMCIRDSHRSGHGLRAGAWELGRDDYGREVDARNCRHRQQPVAEHPENDEGHHQQRRHHRTTDAGLRQVHEAESGFGLFASRTSTRLPPVSRS